MKRTQWLVVLAAALASCKSSGGAEAPVSPQPSPPAAAPEGAVPAPTPSVREKMRAHFAAASELNRAVAQGRLADARRLATWLETKAEPSTPELKTAARRIREAPDLQSAGVLTGTLASACGSCHEANGAAPVFAVPAEPPDGPSIAAQMLRHQWAAARLWEGVVGPNDDVWYSGVRVMESAKIDVRWTDPTPNPEAVHLAAAMRELANQAIDTETREGRAGLYGAMLHTCASCHAIMRRDPVGSTP